MIAFTVAGMPGWVPAMIAGFAALALSIRACLSARHTAEMAWMGVAMFLVLVGLTVFGGFFDATA